MLLGQVHLGLLDYNNPSRWENNLAGKRILYNIIYSFSLKLCSTAKDVLEN